MVIRNWLAPTVRLSLAALADDAGEKLSPTTRAAVLMALLGIALVGLLLIVVVLLGGHWVRRQGLHRRGPSVPPDRAPLRPVGGVSDADSALRRSSHSESEKPPTESEGSSDE